MISDPTALARFIATWRSGVDDLVALLRDLEEADWSRPTDLEGWDVKAVAAHVAHLESELAGNPQEPVHVPEREHIKSLMGVYTEMGPIARADWPPEKIIEELTGSVDARAARLDADPPTDRSGNPPATPGGIGWDWQTLLSNRALDVWMHEQDIRRAVGRPGGLDTPGAVHSVAVFARSFGYAVGKKVGPPPGTTAVLDVTGAQPVHTAVRVNDDGRGVPAENPADSDVVLRMDTETYVLLAGGRRPASAVTVEISGDQELGTRILAALAVTP
jgi:uncharacterized protein (TIGR03083 family)